MLAAYVQDMANPQYMTIQEGEAHEQSPVPHTEPCGIDIVRDMSSNDV